MKYYLIAVFSLLLLTGSVQSQKIYVGAKGGLNAYTILGGQPINFSPKISYHFGMLAHIHISEKFALQPEIVFSGQGARYQNNNVNLRLKYINVPILFEYMFGNGFRLEAGPQLGILASAKSKFNNSKIDVKSQFQGADLGIVVGMSYIKPSTGLGFDIRYNQGLTNINSSSLYRSVNSGIQLGIFFLFGHNT